MGFSTEIFLFQPVLPPQQRQTIYGRVQDLQHVDPCLRDQGVGIYPGVFIGKSNAWCTFLLQYYIMDKT